MTLTAGRPGPQTVVAVTSWPFDDALVQTYTLPYLQMILRRLGGDGRVVLVTQEPERSPRRLTRFEATPGIDVVARPWAPVGPRGARHLGILLLRTVALAAPRSVVAVHAFGTPAGLPAMLAAAATRTPLVVDSFEPHADAMVENGTWEPNSAAHRVLARAERRMAKQAWAVVGTTAAMADYARERLGVTPSQFFVKPACVDLGRFRPAEAMGAADADVVCVYAGKLGGIYLEQELFELFAAAVRRWGSRFRVEMLTSADRAHVEAGCRAAGVDPAIVRSRLVPHDEVAGILRTADFAVNPVRPVPTKRYCTSIKDGEYWASGLPVVITPDISDDSAVIAARRIGAVIRELSAPAYDEAMAQIDALLQPHERERVRVEARRVAEELRSFSIAEGVYDAIYGRPDGS